MQEINNSWEEEVAKLRTDNEGLKRRLQEVRDIERKKREELVESVTERYEESLLACAAETLPYPPVASSTSTGNREDDILRQQQELLEQSRRNVSSPMPSSSPHRQQPPAAHTSIGQQLVGEDDEAERAIADAKEAASRDKRAMEKWIKGQCADMGMDFEQLDDEMRQEMENAYRAQA